jgi:diacylglycerol kinase (ATP)
MSPRVAVVAHEDKLSQTDAGTLRGCLAESGFDDVSWTAITKGSAATKAVRKAVDRGAERIIVAGGDGTVRAAIQALAGTDIPLAVMPTGTANLFAGALSLPTDPPGVVGAMASGNTRRIDTAVCNDLAFAVMAGTGLDAMMIDAADDQKEQLGTLAYVKAGIAAARDRKPFVVRVTVDGKRFFEGEATCVLVGNLGTLKGGIEAFPDASPTDGLLDVGVVTATGLREWGSVMMSAVRKKQALSGHTHIGHGSEITVKLDRKHRFELDGGSKGTAKKLHYTVRPASLSICVA